ncbi:chemotaxis protein CheD [Methylomonas sp. AM2-LC]|uniref:chemotaxis protein CheD n=1 Tax=Methylomonas sp. AM2-LC TaxID=3153301 RepID=UPI003262EC1D
MSNGLPQTPDFCIDIFLHPGEFYFGDKETRIRTLLGSCVTITLWHPRLLIGGMCHYLLPMKHNNKQKALDGRYADDAIKMFLQEMHNTGTWPADYEVKMFGGGNQFPNQVKNGLNNIPDNNIRVGYALLNQHGFKLKTQHVGGTGHRNIVFDVWSGQVSVQHIKK